MKQIKLLMLLVCAAFFGSVNGQVDVTYEYVATYTWTGAADDVWTEAANWTKTSNAPAPTPLNPIPIVLPDFPGTTGTTPLGGITQVHHVVIPSGVPNYPSLRNVAIPITISDLSIAQGATLNLGGRTLVINGFITGQGQLIGGQPQGITTSSSLNVNRLNTLSLYTSQQEMDLKYLGATLFEDFNDGPFGDILPGNNAGAITTFLTQNGYVLRAQGLNAGNPIGGGLFVLDYTSPAPNPTRTIALSTKTELDEVELLFNVGNPVYAFSANFSVTDDDGSPMFLGKSVAFNANQPATTITNDGGVVVTTIDGDIFNFEFNASGEYLGFVSNKPIASVVISTAVFIVGNQNVGFPTVDNIKVGTRIQTGSLNFAQGLVGVAKANELENLTYNLSPVANAIDELTLATPVEVKGSVSPLSGTLRTSPVLTPSDANLILKSNSQATAQVLSHTDVANIVGRTRVERFLPKIDFQTGLDRNKQWRFLGLPFNDPTPISALSGINYSLTTPTMMQFVDFLNTNFSYGAGGTRNTGYSVFNAPGSAIGRLDGFAAWIYDVNGGTATSGTLGADQTLSTAGVLLESGLDVTKTLSWFELGRDIANVGWHLISNPFASTIDWNSASIVKTQIDATIYRWNPRTGAWSTWNGTTGTGGLATRDQADRYIESGASFFVKANAGLPSTPQVVFGQGAKVNSGLSRLNQFSKNNSTVDIAQVSANRAVAQEISALRLAVSGPGNPLPVDALLSLNAEDATSGFDNQYDAYFMGRSSGAAVAINSGNFKLAMQYDKPIAENGKEKRYYPLTVTVPTAGKTKLELNVEGSWNSLNKVYLIDKKEGKTIPLSGNKMSYEFDMTTTQESDRFVLALNQVNIAEKSGVTASDVRVMNNPVRADAIDAIIAHPTAKAKSYSVVNASGATLNKGSIEDNNSVQHRLGFGKSNANGVMYLRVDFDNGDSKTVKFIKL